jgi:hypothetical protein
MSQHEEYTSPPGFRVSGAGGTKLAPVLIDPAAPASEGDVITRVGAGYAPQAPGIVVGETVLFSSAELQALHLTRKTLIPAQGAATMNVPFRLIYRYHAGATPYTSAPGNTLYPQYGDGEANVPSATQPSADFLTESINQTIVSGSFDDMGTLSDVLLNQPLTLIADSALTLGDGTLTVTPLYYVLDAAA